MQLQLGTMDEEEQEKSKPKLMGSEDYVDALQSIQADAWDFDSWNLLIEEVEGDREEALLSERHTIS